MKLPFTLMKNCNIVIYLDRKIKCVWINMFVLKMGRKKENVMLGFSEKDLGSFNSQGRTLRPVINSITPTATPSYLKFLFFVEIS
jgi:hypothetical protein